MGENTGGFMQRMVFVDFLVETPEWVSSNLEALVFTCDEEWVRWWGIGDEESAKRRKWESKRREKKNLCAMIREDGPENERGERKNGKINVKVVYFGKTENL
jgi:hypothetical protein